ncbi:hypothetical protein EJV44_19000 [Ancylobacter aquaticus]|nr:hypothetical protein EJV44_19000 [Ancylobacter aquaticus]
MDAISVVLKLVDQLSAPAKKAKEALTGVKKAAEDVASSATDVTAATTAVTKATEGATAASHAATAASASATKAAADAASVGKKATAAVQDGAKAATAATRATRGLTAQQFRLGRAFVAMQRRGLAALPAIRDAEQLLGLSMRGVALGIRDAAHTSVQLGRSAFEMGKRVAAATGLSIVGVLAVGRSYATALDSQGKFARQTGFSVQALRELGFVAKRQDIPLETLNTGLENLQKRLGELKMRRGALDKLLGRVDPKLRGRLRAEKDPAKSFDMVIEAMSRVKDPAKRMVLAQAAFGEAGAEIVRLALLGADGLAKMRAEAQRLHGVLGEGALEDAERFNDAIDNILDSLLGLRDSVAGAILPVITPIIEALETAVNANRDIIAAGVADAVTAVAAAMKSFDWAKFADNIRSVATAVTWLADQVGGFENLLIGLIAVPFIPALAAILAGVVGFGVAFVRLGKALGPVLGRGGLGRLLMRNAAQGAPALDRLGRSARGAGTDLLGFGRSAGSMRRMLAFGGLLSIASMIADDIGKTKEQRLEEIRQNWEAWDDLEQKLQATTAGQWWQGAVDKVQQWKTDIASSLSSLGTDLVNIGKSWASSLADGFRSGWADFVAWLRSSVAAVKDMIPSLPSWLGGGGETGEPAPAGTAGDTTGALPAPKTMADVVNNVDQSRETQQTVSVTNNVTVNATTNASPEAIGAVSSAAAERGTRRGMAGLHDGGLAGSTYLAGP